MNDTIAQTELKAREIPYELDKLAEATEILAKVAEEMAESLTAVLSPDSPEKMQETKESAALCDMAQRVQSSRIRIEKSTHGLEDLRRRVEL